MLSEEYCGDDGEVGENVLHQSDGNDENRRKSTAVLQTPLEFCTSRLEFSKNGLRNSGGSFSSLYLTIGSGDVVLSTIRCAIKV